MGLHIMTIFKRRRSTSLFRGRLSFPRTELRYIYSEVFALYSLGTVLVITISLGIIRFRVIYYL